MSKPVHMRKGVNYSGNSFSATYADSVIGTILAYGGSTAPYGWFLCQGQAISRTEYHELFEVIGTAFGTGDGSTTFNIPDLRGEFLRGVGNNSHTNQGNGGTVGEHQDATEIPNFELSNYSGNTRRLDWYSNSSSNHPSNQDSGTGVSTELSVLRSVDLDPAGTGKPTLITTRPTNTSVNFIIKAKYSASPAGDVLGVQDIRDTLGETPIPSELGTTVTGALSNIDASNHYSTSETWTGEYWNERKVYSRIVDDVITTYSDNSGRRYFNISVGNNITILSAKGNWTIQSGDYYVGGQYCTESISPGGNMTGLNYAFEVESTSLTIIITPNWGTTKIKLNILVKYTKTT